MTEQDRQTKLKNKLKAEGYIVINLIKTSMVGIPDLLALKDGNALFVEVKKPNGVLSPIQKVRLRELKDNGFKAVVWTDYETEFKYDELDNFEL